MQLDSKYFARIRTRRRAERPEPLAPTCQWDDCEENAAHRAPVGRNAEGQYFLFCFEHVKEYNKSYNYFSGLSDGEIARFQKEALTGHRPTWTISGNSSAQAAPDVSTRRSGHAGYYSRIGDPFNVFGSGGQPVEPRERRVKPLEAKALETLGLDAKATGADIKARYKTLVKRHHPDTNGGDRGSEERFRDVIQAYRLLKQAGLC